MMEKLLKQLFDYQDFIENPRLAEMIDDTKRRCCRAIPDDDLAAVNAAWELPDIYAIRKDTEK